LKFLILTLETLTKMCQSTMQFHSLWTKLHLLLKWPKPGSSVVSRIRRFPLLHRALEGDMRRYALFSMLLVFVGVTGCQTITPEQQHAADQSTCAGYGYQPGTTLFANCMMTIDMRRQDQAVIQQQNDDYMKSLSIRRNGDTRFPVCSPGSGAMQLDTVNNAWYGPDCRER
jgi:hypothetical protein